MTIDAELHIQSYAFLYFVFRRHGSVAGFASRARAGMERVAEENKVRDAVDARLRHNYLIFRHLSQSGDSLRLRLYRPVARHAPLRRREASALASLHTGMAIGAVQFQGRVPLMAKRNRLGGGQR